MKNFFCPQELKERYSQGRVIPFIGAGVSMSVQWRDEKDILRRGPSWGELVDQAATLLGFETAELARVRGTDLQILEYFKRKYSGQTAKLTNWLARLMAPPDDALKSSSIHTQLSQLEKCRVFYTTNFDNFLERSFELNGRRCYAAALESQLAADAHDTEIIKFHGDLDHPDQIVLTESDYEQRLSLAAPMDFRLRADLLGRVVLFLGYSFRDPNVSYLFRLFADGFFGKPGSLQGDRAYVVVPSPSDFELELFTARKIRVLAIDANRMTEDTTELLAEMRQ